MRYAIFTLFPHHLTLFFARRPEHTAHAEGPVAEGKYTLGAMGVMAYDWLDENGQKLKTMLFSILRHHPSCAKVFLPFK